MGIGHSIFGNFSKIKGNISVKLTDNRLNIFFYSLFYISCLIRKNRFTVQRYIDILYLQ